MTKKRSNNGRSKNNRGHVKPVRCQHCGRCTPKDKSIRKLIIKNMVEPAAMADFKTASAYETYMVPKMYQLLRYCVSCAVHSRIVHIRSKETRKERPYPPQRMTPVVSNNFKKNRHKRRSLHPTLLRQLGNRFF